ncbi:TerB family tellurite resistance protein [Yoonia sp.]|uniref:TerB family tellurite resistance protein n=1 Tax=Yoonia sp. TaxID=2212373 RepID=UPI001A07E759|nr:TerB family tellurite resistance protein [Yoonia sp.]MBE0412032.1 TerB family tellurite resistance protein [Yoonia sp.]
MKKLVLAGLLVWLSTFPTHAYTSVTGFTTELEFVAQTSIAGSGRANLSLCYVTRSFRVFGNALTSDVQRYALSDDNCMTEDRPFSTQQMIIAHSLDLIPADIPIVASNDIRRNLKTYGLLAAIALTMLVVILRRVRSILGYDPNGPMRKMAAEQIVSVMCHAAKCDGLVGSKELGLIGRAAKRLTRRNFSTADIIRMADHSDLNLSLDDYIAFGAGLRDREKDAMIYAALLITMFEMPMLPAEYQFVTKLAYGLGVPGQDFRRIMATVLDDLDSYAAN